jgi:hypothetical protein
VQQLPDKQNEVLKWDELDLKLDPFNFNGPNYTSSNGFKTNGASQLNNCCGLFRSSMDFDKKAVVVKGCCPIQDVTAEAASILRTPNADELFSLRNEDDECSEDLQKSENVVRATLSRMLENAEKDGVESFRRQLDNLYEFS